MEDQQRPTGLNAALRVGSHGFGATLLVLAGTALLALWLLPFFPKGPGMRVLATLAVGLLVFVGVLLFKNMLFKRHFKNTESEGEDALLEYLVQPGVLGSGPSTAEEEAAAVELLENALHLPQVRAHTCMTPRPEIVHIDASASLEELRQRFIQSNFSRIPVTDGDLDTVLGYIHVQQLFEQHHRVRDMVMPLLFVPETIQVNDLLNKFIKSRRSLAIVVDEYGSTSGLITLEDALEQLFGDIDDEHDQEEFIEAKVNEREFIFSGRLRIDYLNDKYPELALPEGDYRTLSGYLVAHLQTIPEQGARLSIEGKTFELMLVSDRKVETVRVLL